MNFKAFKAVITDLDGVITQTEKIHAKAWKFTFDHLIRHLNTHSKPFDVRRDYIRYLDGKPRLDGIRDFLRSRRIRLPEGSQKDAAGFTSVIGLGKQKNAVFRKLLREQGVAVYPDAIRFLEEARGHGLKEAVVSSSRNCLEILTAVKMADYFDAKVDGNDLAERRLEGKPAPDMFLEGARLVGAEPGASIVIEDAISGVQAGKAGGFGLVVGVARNKPQEVLRAAGADVVVSSLDELTKEEEWLHGA